MISWEESARVVNVGLIANFKNSFRTHKIVSAAQARPNCEVAPKTWQKFFRSLVEGPVLGKGSAGSTIVTSAARALGLLIDMGVDCLRAL